MEREGRLWGPAQIERVRVHGVELVMMRRPYNFLEENGQSHKEVEDREEELELVQDYDMFSAYPFLTERTPQEKVIEVPFFRILMFYFPPAKKATAKKEGRRSKRIFCTKNVIKLFSLERSSGRDQCALCWRRYSYNIMSSNDLTWK